MLQRKFFHFNGEISSLTTPIGGGYFSFLPLDHHYQIADELDGIFMELEECVLFEIRGNVDPSGFRLDLEIGEIGFWQLYQFINTSQLYMPHSLPVGDSRCISFSTQEQKIPVLFSEGKQWATLIGYKAKAAPGLLKEFPMLATLVFGDDTSDTKVYWEADISINHSLRDVWNRIAQSVYFPFRGKAELLIAVCKLLEEYCRQLDRQADQNERTMLGLYHKALIYINENLLDSINKEMIAKGLDVSVRTLNRAFENRPIKVADYIQQLKLNQAKSLLFDGELTVEQISNLLNYPNRKYFSREFKKYFFQSPTSFQKEMEEFRGCNEEEE